MTRAADIRDDAALLDDIWYFAAPSNDVKRGALLRRIFWDEPVVLGRTKSGEVFALRDVCPHRAAPLSAGRICEAGGDATVECPYHGWRFRARDGACAAVPALIDGDASKISVQRYPLHEANGLIWIYKAGDLRGGVTIDVPPEIGLAQSFRPRIIARTLAEGPYDEAVIGLVDPAHTPVVHSQWWWRKGAEPKEKTKTFEPTALGFKMPAHAPSSNSRIYRIFGGAPTTEIEFRLPGYRLETIRTRKNTVLGLTCITPTEDGKADITHMIFWDMPLLTFIQPVAQSMAQNFLAQDGAILRAQNRNLSRHDHRPLYLGDPDEPAKWYMRLKRAYAARAPGEAFLNPIEGGRLSWRT